MLIRRQRAEWLRHLQLVGEYHVVSAEADFFEAVFPVKVFIDAEKPAIGHALWNAQFLPGNPLKGVSDSLVLGDAPAGNEQHVLGGLIGAAADQAPAVGQANNEINSHKRCQAHHTLEIVIRYPLAGLRFMPRRGDVCFLHAR